MNNPWGVAEPIQTASDFFNAARRTAFLLVEGAADERFWRSRVARDSCQVRALGGRDAALAELRRSQAEGRLWFVAVLDADFDRIDGGLREEPGVVWTDHHDLETMLVDSPALDKVLAEVASPTKRDDFEREQGCHVRDTLRDLAMGLGRLRLLSRREGLKLTFRKTKADGTFQTVDYDKVCERKTFKIELEQMIQTVLNFSQRPDLKVTALLPRLAEMAEMADHDWRQLCVGHDLVGLLSVGLRSRLGSRHLPMDDLQERLRLAYERAHLEQTTLYQTLRRWEQTARCQVLAA